MEGLSGTVKVPGVGPVKKTYVYAAGAGIAVVVGVAYWRSRQAGGEADPAAVGEELPGDDYSSDAYGPDTGDYVNPGGSGASSSTTEPGDVITNNAQWTLAAISALEAVGVDLGAASSALGKFMARQDLTTAQADLVRQALAMVGDPPSGTYEVKVAATGGGGTEDPTTPAGSKGADLRAPSGLATWGAGPSRLAVPLKWEPVPGATGYRVYRSDVSYNVGASTDTSITIGGLTPNKSYTFHVRPMGADGKYGPKSGTITLKTKK